MHAMPSRPRKCFHAENDSSEKPFRCSPLRCVITFARAHLRILHAANLDADFSRLAIARLVSRVVAEAVLRADFIRNLRERGARIAQCSRGKVSTARPARKFI